MSNGKGDKRRPKFIDEKEFDANWQLAFESEPKEPKQTNNQSNE